jgi:microcystin-dependent protein
VSRGEAQSFVGEVITFGGTFCPSGYASAEGILLPFADSDNLPLFDLVGTIYGGDGQTNFALPDLVGAAAVGTGPGVAIGQTGGTTGIVGVETAVAKSIPVPATQSPSLGLVRCVALLGTFPPAAND